MLATLGGTLALLLGLLTLLLPLLASELSRPRDSAWGAVVLLLGLVLVTSADRLSGAPMLGVLCGGLLIGRLGLEVGQGRWRQLSTEEQQRLWSKERWQTSLSQAGAALAQLLTQASTVLGVLTRWLAERRQTPKTTGKRWVRPEPDATPSSEASAEAPAVEVSSFVELDALIAAAEPEPAASAPEAEPETSAAAPKSAAAASDTGSQAG